MSAGSTTNTSNSTQNTMASTNPALTGMFTSLFGGSNGAGATGVNSLSSIASGQNITQLNQALTASNKSTFTGSVNQIKEAFGSSGMGGSSSMGKVLGQAAAQNSQGLTSTIAQSDLQAQGQTLSAANYLSQIFSSSANNYYNNSSSSTGTSQTSQSGMSTFLSTFGTLFPGGL